MSPYRIIIVDDQTDIRRVLQAGIESLGIDYQVFAMPSAEEALVEASRKPIDLLITDFRLPGMSGSELVSKMKRYCPDMKVFIITGMTDPNVHRQVKEAKPDDFFIKPVSLADLLTAVKQTLNQPATAPATEIDRTPEKKETHQKRLDDILARARKELGAEAIALVDRQGKALATAGKLATSLYSSLPAGLVRLLEPSGELAQALGSPPESCLLYIKGKEKNLFVAPAGSSWVLILSKGSEPAGRFTDPAVQLVFQALEEIQADENQSGQSPVTAPPARQETTDQAMVIDRFRQQNVPFKPVKASQPVPADVAPEELQKEAALFEQAAKNRLAPDQVEEFWQAAMNEEDARRAKRPNDINYDEARQLGLAPEDDAV